MELVHILRIMLLLVFGFIITLGMRTIYKRIDINRVNIITVVLSGLLISFLGANLWVWGFRIVWGVLNHGFSAWDYHIRNEKAMTVAAPLFFNSILFISWTALYFIIKYWLNWIQQNDLIQRSREKAQQAQLQMLRYQLNPHFMFNALNAIRALIRENKQDAKHMITELSEVLRYALISRADRVLPLKYELDSLKNYFAIEKRRYEHKLKVHYDIDPLSKEYPVIGFLLQPIAENAIKHGLSTSDMPLQIFIRAEVVGTSLILEVENTGKWVLPGQEQMNDCHHGLCNIRQRLSNRYQNAFSLEETETEGKVKVSIRIARKLSMEYAEPLQHAHR